MIQQVTIKLNNDKLFSLVEIAKTYRHHIKSNPIRIRIREKWELHVLEQFLLKLQQKAVKYQYEPKKEYSLKLSVHETYFWARLNDEWDDFAHIFSNHSHYHFVVLSGIFDKIRKNN